MKKYFSLFLIIVLFGIMFIPNVFANNKVGIKSIELVEKSENTIINTEPKFNNLEMNFDVAFKAKDDYVKYKVVVSNNTSVDYKISEDTSFNDSPYMTYKYDVEKDLKANDETVVYVTITYSKEIDSSKLAEGKYSESNKVIVQLLDKNGNTVNPNTSSSIVMILINLFLILFVSILLLIKFKGNKVVPMMLVLGLSLIPITTNAIETLKLTINVNVEIEKGYKVTYYFIDDWIYLTDEELKDCDVSGAKCDEIYNVNDGTSVQKYTFCIGSMFYNDSRLYYAGEKVDLKPIKVRNFDFGKYDSSTGLYEYCSKDSNNNLIFNCNSNSKDKSYDFSHWYYNIYYSNKYNYPFFDNDKEIMNFDKISYDKWENLKRFGVVAPISFTMPDHDVLFSSMSGDPV